MELKITLSSELASLLAQALCDKYLYVPVFPDLTSNPITPFEFSKQVMVAELLQVIRDFKSKDPSLTIFDIENELAGMTFEIEEITK